MPKYPGIFKKQTKKGPRYYGSKWYKGKTYSTKICSTAEEAAKARAVLIKQLSKGVIDNKNLTVTDFLKVYLTDYIIPKTKIKDGKISKKAFYTFKKKVQEDYKTNFKKLIKVEIYAYIK